MIDRGVVFAFRKRMTHREVVFVVRTVENGVSRNERRWYLCSVGEEKRKGQGERRWHRSSSDE
jgi:hypothetical protein